MQIRVSYDMETLGGRAVADEKPPKFGKKFLTGIKKLGTLNNILYITKQIRPGPAIGGNRPRSVCGGAGGARRARRLMSSGFRSLCRCRVGDLNVASETMWVVILPPSSISRCRMS